jgi:hypothetical protein
MASSVDMPYGHAKEGYMRAATTVNDSHAATAVNDSHAATTVNDSHAATAVNDSHTCAGEGSLHAVCAVGSPCTHQSTEGGYTNDNNKHICMSVTPSSSFPYIHTDWECAHDNKHDNNNNNNNKSICVSDTHASSSCAATDGGGISCTYKEESHLFDSRDGGIYISSACAATVCESNMVNYSSTLSKHARDQSYVDVSNITIHSSINDQNVRNHSHVGGSNDVIDSAGTHDDSVYSGMHDGNVMNPSDVCDSDNVKPHSSACDKKWNAANCSVVHSEVAGNKGRVVSDTRTANHSTTQTQGDEMRNNGHNKISELNKENHSSVHSEDVRSQSRDGRYMDAARLRRETKIESESESESESGQNNRGSQNMGAADIRNVSAGQRCTESNDSNDGGIIAGPDEGDTGANHADVNSSSIGGRSNDNIHDLIGTKLRVCVYTMRNICAENLQRLDLSQLLNLIQTYVVRNFGAENMQRLDLSRLVKSIHEWVMKNFSAENMQGLNLSHVFNTIHTYVLSNFSAENIQLLDLGHLETTIRAYVARNFSAENMQRLNLGHLQAMIRAYFANMAHRTNNANFQDLIEYWSNVLKTTKRPPWDLIATLTVFMAVLTTALRILRSRRFKTPRSNQVLRA